MIRYPRLFLWLEKESLTVLCPKGRPTQKVQNKGECWFICVETHCSTQYQSVDDSKYAWYIRTICPNLTRLENNSDVWAEKKRFAECRRI